MGVNLFSQVSSLRLLSGSVGPAASASDAAALLLLSTANARAGHKVSALLPAAALGLSARAQDGQSSPACAPGAVGASLLSALPAASSRAARTSVSDSLGLAALGLGAALLRPETPRSRTDLGKKPLSGARLRQTRALALGAVAASWLRRESDLARPLALACALTGLR